MVPESGEVQYNSLFSGICNHMILHPWIPQHLAVRQKAVGVGPNRMLCPPTISLKITNPIRLRLNAILTTTTSYNHSTSTSAPLSLIITGRFLRLAYLCKDAPTR